MNVSVILEGDRTQVWTVGKWFTLLGTPIAWIILWCGIVGGAEPLSLAPRVMLLTPAVLGIFGFGLCLFWRATVMRNAYGIDHSCLVAMRGTRVLKRIPLADISSVAVDGWMDVRRIFTQNPPPDWPALVVRLTDGDQVYMPEMMVWGRDAARHMDDQVLKAVAELAPQVRRI
jgi:hypothetical protein